MSKFFIQMLLSVAVAVSAAIGFSPRLNKEVHKTLGEARTMLHQTTEAIFETTASVYDRASTEASLGSETESSIDTNLDLNADHPSRKGLETAIENSFSAESETEAELETNHVNLELEHEIESELDLGAGLAK